MQLYKTTEGNILRSQGRSVRIDGSWDALVNHKDLHKHLSGLLNLSPIEEAEADKIIASGLLPPIGSQEVWAAGVTYLRSRDARMEESKDSGGDFFYRKVYDADRPELFFKALAHRVVGPGQNVRIRKDSKWDVPEPELTLFINPEGSIQGYTAGNDMSSRSIEGENPLYLPQAKMYEGSCALGPCLFVPAQPISPETNIRITIKRSSKYVFDATIQLNRMKRQLPELASWLFREMDFSHGCYLMTGTGLVPGNDFTLQAGDEVSITIDGIGTLTNTVA
ncbi:MAG TPA: fumarylacetoacetate hydrolase family protein [Cyclobacteriaceae bacterium]|nr:fumarylacetoacetate hydrolase family protein [Cyclobacteriaceae bacterium]